MTRAQRLRPDLSFGARSRPLSVLLDAVLGVAAYLASYWLRFHQGEQLATFLAVAWSTAPLVVGGQLAMLAVAQAYARKPRASWLFRVAAGALLGTVASSVLVGSDRRLRGRVAQRVRCRRDPDDDWRRSAGEASGCCVRARSCGRRSGPRTADLVDRADRADDAARRGAQPVPLPRAAQEPGPQGPEAEVPRDRSSASCGRWRIRS